MIPNKEEKIQALKTVREQLREVKRDLNVENKILGIRNKREKIAIVNLAEQNLDKMIAALSIENINALQELEREYRIIVDGHKIKHIANQLKIFYDDITEKILLVGAVQDITEHKISQQLIVEKNLSERSSKIKEEILEDMGFHIRTPLSSSIFARTSRIVSSMCEGLLIICDI